MTRELIVTTGSLPVPSGTNPLPDWPSSLNEMANAIGNGYPDKREGFWVRTPTLPPDKMPTETQRAALERHRTQSIALFDETPISDERYAKKTFGIIAKLLLAKPSRAGGPESAQARVESYEIALDDVPWWAVKCAVRNWHRGECDITDFVSGKTQTFDYRWAPESADLRRIALEQVDLVKYRIEKIERVLTAVAYAAPERKPDGPDNPKMAQRCQQIARGLFTTTAAQPNNNTQ